jgi:RNA ligase
LKIYNYSRDCQFEKKWDSITLAMRGTVIDNEGNLIAKSLNKFFNIEEIGINNLPNEEFEVFEKMDGSCIICFYYNNQWICASRGSFTSPQAIRANELLLKYPIEKLNKKNTYIFEVIY